MYKVDFYFDIFNLQKTFFSRYTKILSLVEKKLKLASNSVNGRIVKKHILLIWIEKCFILQT